MTAETRVPKVLHCHSTFAAGGKEVRSTRLMNAFGKELTHTIVSGMPDQMGAKGLIDRQVQVSFPQDFPSLTGTPTPWRLATIAKALAGYDLVLTYNWGAMDVVMAHTIFAEPFKLPPLIHHEDGFNEDEAKELKTSRNIYRRAALWNADRLVVPSRTLENIALNVWQQPRERVVRIPNGIDTMAFARKPAPWGLRVVKREGERWIGTLAGLRAVKQLPMLVEACAELPENWHCVILGDGPEKDTIREAAERLEVSHRIHLPGAINDPASVIGMFDIFALSSRSEQFPLSVVEAMAAGLPIAAPDVGDVKSIVSEANQPYICVPGSAAALGTMLGELAANSELRKEIGAANRAKARAQFDQGRMVDAYRKLYWAAIEGEG